MKKKSAIVAMMGILMITSGGIMSFVTSFARDVTDSKENIETIQTEYKNFKDLVETLNGKREKVYSDVINELYIEYAQEEYNTWKSALEDYESTVSSIAGYQSMLQDRCVSILYNDSNVQSQCDSMVLSYETAINYYVKDIQKFNSFIDLYNASVGEELKLNGYDLKNYNYIDFNDDGKYLGK